MAKNNINLKYYVDKILPIVYDDTKSSAENAEVVYLCLLNIDTDKSIRRQIAEGDGIPYADISTSIAAYLTDKQIYEIMSLAPVIPAPVDGAVLAGKNGNYISIAQKDIFGLIGEMGKFTFELEEDTPEGYKGTYELTFAHTYKEAPQVFYSVESQNNVIKQLSHYPISKTGVTFRVWRTSNVVTRVNYIVIGEFDDTETEVTA